MDRIPFQLRSENVSAKKMSTRRRKPELVDVSNLITLQEAARLRGVQNGSIHGLVTRGRLRSRTLFGRILVYRDEVLSFVKQKTGPKPGSKRKAAVSSKRKTAAGSKRKKRSEERRVGKEGRAKRGGEP